MKPSILITGGTGFLGKRLALALKEDHNVLLAARNNKQNLQAKRFTGCAVAPMDVSNIHSVRDIFHEFKPDIVIHAAATKFVDLAERYPMECVDVNVLGSQNIARVAVETGVKSVVGISTDKAAPPVRNTYGLSKALMERTFCSMDSASDTNFVCVRYGNVAWSTGSVFPLWRQMHHETSIIGTTGPDMRRFFFTVDDAVQLVLTALQHIHAYHGCVLSREMKAAKLEDILKIWIQEFGGTYERLSQRPGERNDEFLIGDLELPYTSEVIISGIRHFVISFNALSSTPIKEGLSSINADRLSDSEILGLIRNPPVEELIP
jgi:UDP-N-acetylglucosamine 4,6-dehydratase